ncbi:hypothetical protein PhCBS80983_g01542 [Powellomyces hirtus]|uniref:SET domain-containing protein n=1 Tax=Powellomyces hirtus TaxID=109895 RepID=A0A507ECN2_9FUNG|nr:hypothetical protein PhCBS80983_g01542 [Powellomyces hirtus]
MSRQRTYRQKDLAADSEEEDPVQIHVPRAARKPKANEVFKDDSAPKSSPVEVPAAGTTYDPSVPGALVPLSVKKSVERGRGIYAQKKISAVFALYRTLASDAESVARSSIARRPVKKKTGLCTSPSVQDSAKLRRESRRQPFAFCVEYCGGKAQTQLRKASLTTDYTPEKLESFAQMTMLIRLLVGEDVCLSGPDMLDLLCRFSCNSISVSDEELVNIGVGVFPTLALVNHSCTPNAAIIFAGSKGVLRTIKEVGAGEELFQSYMEIAEPRYVRHKELKDTYFFDCACPVCTLHKQSPDPRTTYICKRPGCAGVIDLPDRLDNAICTAHRALSPDEQSSLEENVTNAFQLYQRAVQLQDKDAKQASQTALRCHALQESLMAPVNSALLHTNRLLLSLSLAAKDYPAAYSYSKALLEAYRVLYQGYHPAVSVQAYMNFKLAEWSAPEDRPLLARLGDEAVMLLEKSHGTRSGLWKEAKEKLALLRSGVPGSFT